MSNFVENCPICKRYGHDRGEGDTEREGMTIDINKARKLAENMEHISKFPSAPHGIDDAARTIRELCDRENEARKLIQALAWRKHPTQDGVWMCSCCDMMQSDGVMRNRRLDGSDEYAMHYATCKLSAWLVKETDEKVIQGGKP